MQGHTRRRRGRHGEATGKQSGTAQQAGLGHDLAFPSRLPALAHTLCQRCARANPLMTSPLGGAAGQDVVRWGGQRGAAEGSKNFFFEKKKQKTFVS
jgi:hypothetical protein